MRVSVAHVEVGSEERRLVDQALTSGSLAQGKLVQELEAQFTELSGSTASVATSSGTTSLQLALEVAGVGPGDEVITSPFTFVATLNAILSRGAIARLVDIDPGTFNMRPDLVEATITSATKALMPVHLYGLPADMDSFTRLCASRGLRLVEDAAQAHLATANGYRVGTFDLGCFSLYATKNMTAGEGGLITVSRPEDADLLRALRNQGMRDRYEYVAIGYNYRLTDVAAAIGLGQLQRLQESMERRRRNADFLTEALHDIPGIATPVVPAGYGPVWHQYTIRVQPGAALTRNQLAARLAELGIGTGVYYPKALVDYPIFRDHPRVLWDDVSVARTAAAEVLSLPVHPYLDQEDLDAIASGVREALGGN